MLKLSELFNPYLWFKYHNKTINGVLYQTSYLKSYQSKTIQIENYIMKKLFLNIFFWNSHYFNLFRRLEPFLIPILLERFKFEQAVIDFQPDFYLLDANDIIKFKTIAKDLILVEFKDYQTLISKEKELNEDLNIYVTHKKDNYVSYSLDLLNDYTLEDLRVIFGSISNGLAFIKSIIKQETKKEEEQFKKIFYFSRLEEKPLNAIIFNKDFQIAFSELKNNPYWVLFGSAGSGKSFLLFHILLNVILSGDYKAIYVYDTQDLFKEHIKKLKFNYFKRLEKIKEQKGIYKITESNLYLTEEEVINALNLLLEEKGLITEEEKRKTLKLNISNKNVNEIKQELKLKIKEMEKRKDFKSLSILELYKELYNFLDTLKIRDYSLFESEIIDSSIIVFSFKSSYIYSFISYLLLNDLYNSLRNRKQKQTFLFFDETQKYIENSELLKEKLINLMKEKRQFGFRVFFTSLTYKDTSDLYKYTTNLIFNDLNDIFLRNLLLNRGIEPTLNKPKEKVITDSSFTTINKVFFEPFLFEK